MPSLSFMVKTTLRSTPFLAFRIDISGSFPAWGVTNILYKSNSKVMFLQKYT